MIEHEDGRYDGVADGASTAPGRPVCDLCGAVLEDAMAHLSWHLLVDDVQPDSPER